MKVVAMNLTRMMFHLTKTTKFSKETLILILQVTIKHLRKKQKKLHAHTVSMSCVKKESLKENLMVSLKKIWNLYVVFAINPSTISSAFNNTLKKPTNKMAMLPVAINNSQVAFP